MGDEIVAMKRRAAEWAVDRLRPGQVVGLGTGSTAALAIEAIGERGLDVVGVPTSTAARERAHAAGVDVVDPGAVDGIDVAIDGADAVAGGTLLKGGGGAHATERVVDGAAERFIVVVDERKRVDVLAGPVALEVLPVARRSVERGLAGLGAEVRDRRCGAVDGPVHSERGNPLLDAEFGRIDDPAGLADRLDAVPGVVDHGLFVGLADVIAVGTPDGTDVYRPSETGG